MIRRAVPRLTGRHCRWASRLSGNPIRTLPQRSRRIGRGEAGLRIAIRTHPTAGVQCDSRATRQLFERSVRSCRGGQSVRALAVRELAFARRLDLLLGPLDVEVRQALVEPG